MLNVLNCPRCGKIYAKNFRELCLTCIKLTDEECDRCNKYLRENKIATIEELSKATNVETGQIIRFIRENRISIAKNPNIHYACESCATSIREGNLCSACRQRFLKSLNNPNPTPQQENNNRNEITYKNKHNKN